MINMKQAIAAALAVVLAAPVAAAQLTAKYKVTSAVGSGNDHAVWIKGGLGAGIGSDFDFDSYGLMRLYDDGTATMKGKLVSQTRKDAGFVMSYIWDNTYAGFSPKFKSENGSKAVAGETFYRDLEGGTLSGRGVLKGLELSVTRKPAKGPYATQIGPSNGMNKGANNKNKNFGIATWFSISVDQADCEICLNNTSIASLNGRQGDINADLAPVPLPAAGMMLVGGIAVLGGVGRRAKGARQA